MGYQVFEAIPSDEGPLAVDIVAAPLPGPSMRVVGTYVSFEAALREVARLEARARRKLRGAGGFALGIRAAGEPAPAEAGVLAQ